MSDSQSYVNSPLRENTSKLNMNKINSNISNNINNSNNNTNVSKNNENNYEESNPNYYYNPINNKVFKEIIKRFKIFSVIEEQDIDELKSKYSNSLKLSNYLNKILNLNSVNLKHQAILEIFLILTKFCIENSLENYEFCALFSIVWDIMSLDFHKLNKSAVFKFFKESVVTLSVDRPPFQVCIFKKKLLDNIIDFFINNIYCKFELLKYLTTERKLIEIKNCDVFQSKFPQSLDLEFGEELLPRQVKYLKDYYEEKKPKSDLEIKIDKVMNYQRDILEKDLKVKFEEQDINFNKKLDDLLSKKKK